MKPLSSRRSRRVLVVLTLLLWFAAVVVFMDAGALAWWLFGLSATAFLLFTLLVSRALGSYGWPTQRLDERQQGVMNRAGLYAYLLVGSGTGAIFGARFGYSVGSDSYTRFTELSFGVGELLLLALLAIFAGHLMHAWLEPDPIQDEVTFAGELS